MSQQYRELRPSDTSQSQQGRSVEVKAKKRPQIYAACERCRSLKSKCDGARPSCARCVRNQQVCKYDTAAGNETRTQSLKRSLEGLQIENSELHELLHHLRSRPRPEADEILNRLRSKPGVQVSALLEFIKDGDLLAESFARSGTSYDVNLPETRYPAQFEMAGQYPIVYSLELSTSSTTHHDFISAILHETFGNGTDLIWNSKKPQPSSSMSPLSALSNTQSSPTTVGDAVRSTTTIDFTRLPDERIEQAKCKPWTTVIKNDNLFRRLLTIYFTWLHPSFCLFDQSLFLNDLVAGDIESKYCSPMLVNAILSLSYLHYVLIDPSKDQEPTVHGLAFTEEALKYHTESPTPNTLTKIQAIMLVGIIYQCLGKDKAAFTYQEIAVKAAIPLGRNQGLGALHQDQDLYFVQQTTTWGIFQLNNLSHFSLRRPLLFDTPPQGSPPKSRRRQNNVDEHWAPLPYAETNLRPHLGQETFIARCNLWKIGADINRQWYHTGTFVSLRKLEEAEAFYGRLLNWAKSIDTSLEPTSYSPPHVLLLFSWFHIMTMEIFRPFAERGAARLQTLASSHSQADMIFAESFKQLKLLFVLLTGQYNPCLIPLEFLQVLTVICLECQKDLAGSSESCKLFIMSYSILRKLSYSFPVLLAVLRFIRDAVILSPVETPPALDLIFMAFNRELQAHSSAMTFGVALPDDLSESEDESMSDANAANNDVDAEESSD